jgi:hypothetical protein
MHVDETFGDQYESQENDKEMQHTYASCMSFPCRLENEHINKVVALSRHNYYYSQVLRVLGHSQ